mgnify:CR=1 FL=1
MVVERSDLSTKKIYRNHEYIGHTTFCEKSPLCLETINPSDKNYCILCSGCSFTHCHKGTEEFPYASYLPGHVFNIGKRGFGISPKYLKKFIKVKPDINLTHFIYQVPCPTRQPVDLSDYNENHFRALGASFGIKSLWMQLAVSKNHFNSSLQGFDKIEEYHKKALYMVNKSVDLIRETYPNAKIIFLKFEHTIKPLIYEFSRNFYKKVLTNYCEKNDIPYINEKNFGTKWFKRNNYGSHPNRAGARLIADKIEENL